MDKSSKVADAGKASTFRKMLKNPFSKMSAHNHYVAEPIAAISTRLSTQETPPVASADLRVTNAAPPDKPEEKVAKKPAAPPPGTFEHVVKEGESLRGLAAQFDTTQSVLKKLNKLTMDFLYPDQVLRIPGEDYVALNTPKPVSQIQLPQDKASASKDVSKVSAKVLPGRIIRTSTSCQSFEDDNDLPPRPLSQDEAEYLDQECFERFIKIECMYMTEHDGPVDGVLLVTPNAVMFDPNVSNPIVIEKGTEEFGMIAKMDTIMSASIFHDREAMESVQKRKSDSSVAKPTVYHSPSPLSSPRHSLDQQEADSVEEQTCDVQNELNIDSAPNAEETPSEGSTSSGDLDKDSNDDVNAPPANQVAENAHIENGMKNSPSFTLGDSVLLNPSILANDSAAVLPDLGTSAGNGEPSDTNVPPVDDNQSDAKTDATGSAVTPAPEMMPDGLVTDNHKQLALEPSLYLCLRVGQPITKSFAGTCPIESYSKKKRPEYWFSIPRDRVDLLYAFFIQWKPEAYDSEESAHALGNEGFVAVTEDGVIANKEISVSCSPETRHIEQHIGRHISLDWEIVNWEEVRRRKTIDDIEQYLPMPELKSESLIITEEHIKQLVRCLPARIEGCPWELAFGSEQHGFSLNQMYRNLQSLDCPVLLVILTTEEQIFGALSSCPFHMSDLFYGTGESFLYTFVDGFKTYPWSGANNFFNKGDQTCLSIGSGEGSYGIWVDGDVYLGRTQNCQTYANDPLTGGKEDFHIKQLEVWCFHDD